MLVAIGSVKGSPGVSSLAVALAARWPGQGAVVVELDPAGGDLAFRWGHHRSPGLTDLAADSRGGQLLSLDPYAQKIALGVDVVFAPGEAEAGVALRMLATTTTPRTGRATPEPAAGAAPVGLQVLQAAAAGDRLVVMDVGRLGWQSPALPLALGADILLLMTSAWPDGIDAVEVRRDRLLTATGRRAQVSLVLSGPPGCTAREAADATRLPVLGQVPPDPRAAAVLAGRTQPGRGWTRLDYLRAARGLAQTLQHNQLSEPPSTPSPAGPRAAAPPPARQAAAPQPTDQQPPAPDRDRAARSVPGQDAPAPVAAQTADGVIGSPGDIPAEAAGAGSEWPAQHHPGQPWYAQYLQTPDHAGLRPPTIETPQPGLRCEPAPAQRSQDADSGLRDDRDPATGLLADPRAPTGGQAGHPAGRSPGGEGAADAPGHLRATASAPPSTYGLPRNGLPYSGLPYSGLPRDMPHERAESQAAAGRHAARHPGPVPQRDDQDQPDRDAAVERRQAAGGGRSWLRLVDGREQAEQEDQP